MKSNTRRMLLRIAASLAMLLALPLGLVALYWLVTIPDVSMLARVNPSSTALMRARTAEAATRGKPEVPQWAWVPLSRISPHLRRAVIVAEDAAFYWHEGFDWQGIKDAAARNLEAGKWTRGGSTLTQQLAKNLYLSSEKRLLRKLNEALITRELEHHLSKKRILELYINVVEWGRGVYGAEAAARHHFGKPAGDLSPEEAALLAAILPNPRLHDPLEVTPYLAKRQRWILRWMGKISTSSDDRPVVPDSP